MNCKNPLLKTRSRYLKELAVIMVNCGSDLTINEQIEALKKYHMDLEEILDLIDMFKAAAPKKILEIKCRFIE